MLTFSYTIDVQLRTILSQIDRVRTIILSLPIPLKDEAKLQWEGCAIRTWATLSRAGYQVPKQYVATILAHPTKPTRAVSMIQTQKSVYDYIHSMWRANPKPVTVGSIETIYTMLYPQATSFRSAEPSIRELLSFLDTANEHPVVQAAIAHIHLLTLTVVPDPGLLARSVHYLILSKYGYDVRGWVTPDRQWHDDPVYERLSRSVFDQHLHSKWLEYIAEGMLTNLESLLTQIKESRFYIEFPPSFWELSDRQKQILAILERPDERITNRAVQKKFHVSQITASRDLTKLTSLGHLYPHGKGRSVYYTRI